jgi:hypothetical protein
VRFFIFHELLCWVISETIAGRYGRYHIPFEGYLANKVLEEKLDGKRLESVLLFLLKICTRDYNVKCLDIVAYRHAKSLPLRKASNQTLAGLITYCQRGSNAEHTIILGALEQEARRRCESE